MSLECLGDLTPGRKRQLASDAYSGLEKYSISCGIARSSERAELPLMAQARAGFSPLRRMAANQRRCCSESLDLLKGQSWWEPFSPWSSSTSRALFTARRT